MLAPATAGVADFCRAGPVRLKQHFNCIWRKKECANTVCLHERAVESALPSRGERRCAKELKLIELMEVP
jgi:hypothetical protein